MVFFISEDLFDNCTSPHTTLPAPCQMLSPDIDTPRHPSQNG